MGALLYVHVQVRSSGGWPGGGPVEDLSASSRGTGYLDPVQVASARGSQKWRNTLHADARVLAQEEELSFLESLDRVQGREGDW